MKLYICGNGFDLHNGFKTSFGSYMNYLECAYPDTLHRSKRYLYTGFFNRTWTDVESNLKFDYRRYIEDYCTLFNTEGLPTELNREILSQFRENNFADDIQLFTTIYLFEWITLNYEYRIRQDIPYPNDMVFLYNNSDDRFLTFNYTTTLEDVFGISERNILHVHGNMKTVDCHTLRETHYIRGGKITELNSCLVRRLQFGCIENSPDPILNELKKQTIEPINRMFSYDQILQNIEHICQYTYKSPKTNYRALEEFIENPYITDVIILGHSFDGVDEPYYRDIIIPNLNAARWTFYIHSESERTRAKQFANKYRLSLSDTPFINW